MDSNDIGEAEPFIDTSYENDIPQKSSRQGVPRERFLLILRFINVVLLLVITAYLGYLAVRVNLFGHNRMKICF